MDTVTGRGSTAKKRKAGRPKKPNRRSDILMVRLTPAERIIIENKAREAGMKASEWFRRAARRATVTPLLSPEQAVWLRTLSGVANNLNQLTRLAHTNGLISLAAECRKLMEQVRSLNEKLLEHGR